MDKLKFKIGDTIQYKGKYLTYTYTIKDIDEDSYILDNDKVLSFACQDGWELL